MLGHRSVECSLRFIRRGTLPAIKVGRYLLIHVADLSAMLDPVRGARDPAVKATMIEQREAGYSYGAIAEHLNRKGFRRLNGTLWTRKEVHQMLKFWGKAGPVPLRRTLRSKRSAKSVKPDDRNDPPAQYLR